KVPRVAMLLRNDFDSVLTRQHLFRFNPYFSTKIVLLNRIKWFDGPSSPSDNHSWFIWDHTHAGDPPAGGHSCNGDDTTFYGCALDEYTGREGAPPCLSLRQQGENRRPDDRRSLCTQAGTASLRSRPKPSRYARCLTAPVRKRVFRD